MNPQEQFCPNNSCEARGQAGKGNMVIHSLRLLQDMGEHVPLISSLIGAAGLALQESNPQFAVHLLGAVESALKMFKAIMKPEMIRFHAKTLAATREQLGESVFQSAWEEGAGWTLEEAVAASLVDPSCMAYIQLCYGCVSS